MTDANKEEVQLIFMLLCLMYIVLLVVFFLLIFSHVKINLLKKNKEDFQHIFMLHQYYGKNTGQGHKSHNVILYNYI